MERAVLMAGGSWRQYRMVRRDAAARVIGPMYLVPPCAALLAGLLFDERLRPLVLAGLALKALGVGVVMREPGRKEAET